MLFFLQQFLLIVVFSLYFASIMIIFTSWNSFKYCLSCGIFWGYDSCVPINFILSGIFLCVWEIGLQWNIAWLFFANITIFSPISNVNQTDRFFINFLQSKPQCKWHLCGIFDMFFSNFYIVIWRCTRKVINSFLLELKHRFLATEKWEWKSRYIGNENFLRGFSRRIQKNSIFISLLSVKFRIIWQMIDSRDNKK